MVTNKELDFSTYNQTFKFVKLGLFGRILVKAFRLFKINTTAYKLDFFEKMSNFLRIIALEVLVNNSSKDSKYNLLENSSNLNDANKENQSLIEFLYQFKVIVSKKDKLRINDKYKRLIENNAIEKIVNQKDKPLFNSLTKREKHIINDFLLINDLIKKYNSQEYSFQYINTHKNRWETLINEKELDYEVRLCETLYNLKYLKLPQKIKSPFTEDYYTESGRNAFKNYTKHAFLDYLKNINQGNRALSVFDLGCGYGNYIEIINNNYPNSLITGIELNPDVCSFTNEKFKEAKNIEIVNEDFFGYPVNKKYDIILMNYVLFYFTPHEKLELFKKAKNMIAENGSIIICQYFSGIEKLKKDLAKRQHNYSLSKRIEMYYSDKILYANTLWNDTVDTFSDAVKWDEFQAIISKLDLHINSITNADKFYYSLFIELKKN